MVKLLDRFHSLDEIAAKPKYKDIPCSTHNLKAESISRSIFIDHAYLLSVITLAVDFVGSFIFVLSRFIVAAPRPHAICSREAHRTKMGNQTLDTDIELVFTRRRMQ